MYELHFGIISLWGDVRRLACRGSMGRLGEHRIGWGDWTWVRAGVGTQANQGVFVLMCLLLSCSEVGNPGRIGRRKEPIANRDRVKQNMIYVLSNCLWFTRLWKTIKELPCGRSKTCVQRSIEPVTHALICLDEYCILIDASSISCYIWCSSMSTEYSREWFYLYFVFTAEIHCGSLWCLRGIRMENLKEMIYMKTEGWLMDLLWCWIITNIP